MDEVKKARAKVRERERAIWNRVETVGREARAADGVVAKASATATAGTDAKKGRRKRLAPVRDKPGRSWASGDAGWSRFPSMIAQNLLLGSCLPALCGNSVSNRARPDNCNCECPRLKED